MPAILAFLGKILGTIIVVIGPFARSAASTIGLAIALVTIGFLLRILFMLAKAYLTLILLLVFGPLIITVSVLTDAGDGVKNWLRNLVANALVFPVTGLVIAFGGILIDRIGSGGGNLWAPPLLGGDTRFLAGVLGIGILLLIPEIGNLINQFLAPKAPTLPLAGLPQIIQRSFQDFRTQLGQSGGRASAGFAPPAAAPTGPGAPGAGPTTGP